MPPSVFILAAALAAGAVQAQQVWRCGNTYQAIPCTGGQPVSATPALDGGDPRGAAAAARADAQRAAAMEKARLDQAKAAPQPLVIGPAEAQSKAPGEEKKEKKKAKDGQAAKPPSPFTAIGIAPKK